MPRRAAQPTVKREGYLRTAVPQKTPERSLRERKTGSYEVVGPRAVFGLAPGEVGPLELTKGEERALIEAGHLVPAEEGHPADDKKKKDVKPNG